ncbi:hypothetical protein PS647_06269 [Pseudomonas fluorescens]|nr:hypothetical protein PS647_06269 [Pseudomonas fluorescens]
MDVNDDAGSLAPRSVLGFVASKLAPTGVVAERLVNACSHSLQPPAV